MEISESEFYRLAANLTKQSKEGKFAAKSPVLLLPSEQKGRWREEYYQAIIKRIKNGKLKTYYLFSLPYLKSEINKLTAQEAEKILNWWELLLTYSTLDLRFTERPVERCIIGNNQILLKENTRRFVISPNFSKAEGIIKNFNIGFESATKSTKIEIEKIRKLIGVKEGGTK